MSSDDKVSIELVAKIDELASGIKEGQSLVKESVDAIRGDLHEMEESSKETESVLKEMLSGENFIVLKEKAEMALEAVKGAFEHTVGAAEEFGLSTQKFADQMGISTEKAAGLQAALTNVGSSTETYESIAIRLQKSLESTGGASAELKDQFRDANGQFLSGAPLMERLKEVTDSYAEGSARTSVEIALLGRQTKAYYDIARVTADDVERQSGIYKQMGVDFSTLTEQSRRLEDAEGDLRTAWQAEQVVIGQQLMPVAQAAMQWLGGQGKELIGDAVIAVKALETGFAALKTAVVEAVIGMTGVLATLWQSLKLGGTLLKDVLTGDFSSIANDWESGTQKVRDAWSATGRAMSSEFKDFDKEMSAIWDNQAAKAEEVAGKASGGGKAAPKQLFAGKGGGGNPDAGAEEGIKTEEKISLAKIATEESTNAHLLAMGRETADAFVEQQRQFEDAKYVIQERALEKELQLPHLTEAARQKVLDEMRVLEQSHQDALTKIDQEGESKRAEAAKAALATFIKADDERLKAGIAALQEEAAAGQITLDQRDQGEIALTQSIRREQLARLDAEIATLTAGTPVYEEMLRRREQIEKQFTADLKTENAKRRADIEASVNQWVTPISGGFKTAMNDMLLHGKNFTDSMKGLFQGLADGFVNMVENMGEKWIEQQITNALIATTTSQTAATAQITANAGVAASGAAASQAGIPIVGPGLAIAAGATMLAFVLGYEALAHAAGGMVVDRDRLVFAHKEEMILPANISRGMQQVIGQSGGQSVGDITLHYAPNITAPASATLDQLLREQPGAMVAWLAQARRDGKLR